MGYSLWFMFGWDIFNLEWNFMVWVFNLGIESKMVLVIKEKIVFIFWRLVLCG